MLPLYLRRIGMDIGKRVVLGDGATVSAMCQAHTADPAAAEGQAPAGAGAAHPGVLAGRPDLHRARRAAGPSKFARYGAVRSNR